ncbi:MAG TPA: CRISPR-associated protein Csx15 [Anaerolineaceae bacterium]|nr:CRISPR-associated protein Csx15 [Anaerolineaceae bacterium]HPN53858.1 CRISPR-associated protein Csx15 [Anaerolineaceae bacterium]
MTIILNFSHPLTEENLAQVEALTGNPVERVISIPVQFDTNQSFLPQLEQMMGALSLSSEELQTLPVLINPPALNFITVMLMADLHGRMGYFPPVLRLRPVAGALPPRFEVAEILNLQAVREQARKKRFG